MEGEGGGVGEKGEKSKNEKSNFLIFFSYSCNKKDAANRKLRLKGTKGLSRQGKKLEKNGSKEIKKIRQVKRIKGNLPECSRTLRSIDISTPHSHFMQIRIIPVKISIIEFGEM